MQAFTGIRVLDFTQVLAGPFAVMQLAVLGAEVIKIESPKTGDQTRGLLDLADNQGLPPAFMGMNLNKRSLTLDLKSPRGRKIVEQLVQTADLVVENFKAGTMERMGLGYENLAALKPDLIYCSISGYGQAGPQAGAAAYDGAIQASSGMMSQTGFAETGPTRTGYMPVDMATALNAAFAMSAALLRREKGGGGQRLDVAMQDSAMVVQATQFNNYLNGGHLLALKGNASPTGQPTADVFPTGDGHIQITAIRQPQVEKLFEALGLSQLLSDDEFATSRARSKQPVTIKRHMSEALAARTTAEWMKQLDALGIPVAEVRSLPEVMDDPQLDHRDLFAEFPSPRDGQPVKVVKAGFKQDADGPSLRTVPPTLGEHSDEILKELGYSTDDISELRAAGVV